MQKGEIADHRKVEIEFEPNEISCSDLSTVLFMGRLSDQLAGNFVMVCHQGHFCSRMKDVPEYVSDFLEIGLEVTPYFSQSI